jgi:DNA (cytosine-5)-methyltransferase 1
MNRRDEPMRYGSVCSGIEAASVAWLPLDWRPVWLSEIDPFCCALLARHYPDVPNLGDIRNVTARDGPVDVLVGGTPCQDFSVNGLRRGLAGDRGSVTSRYLDLAEALGPRWVVWENVVGVLDADRGLAFGTFLGSLADRGYSLAWRVLDLADFGVPQRRRRLFLVGHLGAGSLHPAFVLADLHGGGNHARPGGPLHREGADAAGRHAGPFGWTGDPTPKCAAGHALTLRAAQGGEGAGVGWPGRARRFTVREWERLSGLPDDYTLVPFRGRAATDSVRRHALGNTFPPPVLAWLGGRMAHLERMTDVPRTDPGGR